MLSYELWVSITAPAAISNTINILKIMFTSLLRRPNPSGWRRCRVSTHRPFFRIGYGTDMNLLFMLVRAIFGHLEMVRWSLSYACDRWDFSFDKICSDLVQRIEPPSFGSKVRETFGRRRAKVAPKSGEWTVLVSKPPYQISTGMVISYLVHRPRTERVDEIPRVSLSALGETFLQCSPKGLAKGVTLIQYAIAFCTHPNN